MNCRGTKSPSRVVLSVLAACVLAAPCVSIAQGVSSNPPGSSGDSVTLRLVNTDLRVAVQALAQYLDRPVLFNGPSGTLVSLETPRPVARENVVKLLRGLLESQNYELSSDTVAGLYRARVRPVSQQGAQPGGNPSAIAGRGPGFGTELFVIQLKYARSVEVAATVNALYGRGNGYSASTGLQASTLSDELRANVIPPGGLPQAVLPGLSQRPSTGLSGETIIVPDARGNNLLIRSNRADYELIQTLVQRLDVRPLQVLIEVIIAEVRRNRSLSLGVDGKLKETTVAGTGSSVSGSFGNTGLGDFALSVMKLGGLNLDATLNLASQRGDVKILSRPIVLTANNQRAEIVVGSQRPFVQLQRSLPTDNSARDQVVQYKDVGTKLTVLPIISVDGTVQLEVVQEVSNATTETAFNAPVISTRSVRTDLIIRDGQTVALGGLTDREKTVDQGGLPFLSSIPILGGLTGHTTRNTNETELFIFLTPHLIKNDADAAKVTAPLQERVKEMKP